jgi:uncharacterized protein
MTTENDQIAVETQEAERRRAAFLAAVPQRLLEREDSIRATVGKACPFLVDEQCSVYDNRPLACRKHASYYTNEKWCSPPYLNTVQAPLVRFGGLDEALAVVSARKTAPVFADIRDFFGTPK